VVPLSGYLKAKVQNLALTEICVPWKEIEHPHSLKCAAVTRRARIKAHRLCVSLNSRLESNKEEEEDSLNLAAGSGCGVHLFPSEESLNVNNSD